jgi:hypothetical protein
MLVFRELVTRDDTWIRARPNKYRTLLCRTSLYTIITKGAPQGPGPLVRKCLIRVRNVVTMNTGMLHEEATIRTTASTLKKYYVGKSLRLVCGPVCVSASGHAILADNAVEALADEILLFATLITPNSFFRTNRRSRSRAWRIWSLYQGNSSPSVQKRPHSKGGRVMTTMTEVREPLSTNPTTSVYKHGLLDENMNILQSDVARKI